jgi:excisionase family DNA binding protein
MRDSPVPAVVEVPALMVGQPWTLDEAAAYLRVCRRHLVRLADDGRIRTIYVGRRRLVPYAELMRVAAEGVD